MFSIDNRDALQLEDDLKTFGRRALPFATKATLNQGAFKTRGFAQENIRNDMVTRNRFTESSVRVEQARTLQISQQEAIVGSIADYMEAQEFGDTKTSTGKHGTPIATSYSAGQGANAQPRTRLPRRANRLGTLKLSKRLKQSASRKQQNLLKIKQAAATGQKYVFLDLGKTKGVFKVIGGKRRPRIKMIHDMSRKSVVIPKSPWLLPAVAQVTPMMSDLYASALRFQLRRLGLFT